MKNGYSQKWKNTVVSLLMAMTMVISILPMSASAQDTQDIITFGTSDVATPATTSDNSVILTGDGEGCTCDSFCSDPDCTVCKDDKTQCFYYYCVCESACDENNANAECPVCKDDYTSCAQAVEVPELAAMAGQRTTVLDFTFDITTDTDMLASEGWKWVQSTKTLTLNGLDLSVVSGDAIALPSAGATIVLEGENSIAQTSSNRAGIAAYGPLTIEGTGTLNITSSNFSAIESYGVFTMKSGTVMANAGGNGIEFKNGGANFIMEGGTVTLTSNSSSGIYTTADLTMTGGTLTTTGSDYGLDVTNDPTINGGTVTAIGTTRAIRQNYYVPSGYAYYVNTSTTPSTTQLIGNGSNTIIGSTHKYAKITQLPNYTLYYNSTNGKMFKNSDRASDEITTADVPGWSGSGATLTLNEGFNFTTSALIALSMPAGTTIQVDASNASIGSTNDDGNGIVALGNLTIKGAGKLTATSNYNTIDCYTNSGALEIDMNGGELIANVPVDNCYAIYAKGFSMKNGTLKATASITGGSISRGLYINNGAFSMTGGSIEAKGNQYGIYITGTGSDFTMSSGTIIAKGNTNAVAVLGTVPDNLIIKQGPAYTADAVFDGSPKTIKTTAGGSPVTDAKITFDTSTNYTLYCNAAGQLYKDSGFATPYTEQTGKWSSSFGKLTLLEGFDFTTSAATALVMPAATTIQVDGNSTITSTFAGSGSYSYGIYDSGNLTIDVAEGKILNVTAGTPTNSASYGIGIDSGGFEKKGKGTLNAKGGENTSNDSIGIEMIGNFLMTDGIIFATGRGTTATKRSMAVYGGTAPTSGISIKAYDGTGYNDAATFETHSSGGIFIMDSNSNVVADTKITIDSSYDYTLEFSGSDGVLRKKGDSYTQPFVKGVDYTVSGMTLTLKEGFEFVTSANVALEVPAGTTIKADGDSRLESTFSASNDGSKGIDASGALTIDVAAGKTLTVISGSGTMNSGINTANSLTKSGTGTLKSTGSSGMGSYPYSHGICVNAGSFIMNGGIVYADIPDSATGDAMYVKNNNVPDNIIVMGKDAGGDYTVEAQFTGGWPVLKSDPTTVVKAAKLTVTVPGPGHSISGTITDNTGGTPTGTVTVKLYRGTTQVGGTVTLSNAPYNYSFNELSDGVYYIVAEHTTDGSKATLSAVINGANVTGKTVRLLPGSMESEIKIKSSGTPPTAVDGLDNLFDASDNIVVGLGGSVAITLEVEKKTAPVDADVIKGAATGQTVGLFLDLSVLKTQKDPNGSIINSDRLTDLTSLITIVFELPADLRGKSNLKIFRSHNGVAEELTATPNADGETAVVSGNIVTMTVCKFSTYAITYTPTGGGGSGSSSGTAYESPTVSNWLEPIPATLLANEAKKANQDTVFTRTGYTYGVRKASWQNLKGYFYYHDTMEKKAVQVRLYVDNPAAMTRDMYVTGAVKGSIVDSRKAMFEEWFTNKARIVHMDESAPWGQEIQIAAKVDLTEMDIKRLCFYSYDSRTNTYTRINNPKYFIDKNKYLHFYTELAGDIVISDGPLERK